MDEITEAVKYMTLDTGEILNVITGEIIDLGEVKKAKEKQFRKEFQQLNDDLHSIGQCTQYVLIKYRNETFGCVSIKSKYYFNKEFRSVLQELILNDDLSRNAKSFLFGISTFVSFPQNTVLIKYKNPEIEDLELVTSLKKSALYETMKDLEDKQIIKRVKRNGQMIIYMNPFIICSGGVVEHYTYELFKNSPFNPDGVNK